MKPEKKEITFEKVKLADFIEGVIEDIQYDQKHKFYFQGKETLAPGVRFKFKLEGYEYSHYSSWMSFSYNEKSNLYQKYLKNLVEGAYPDMDFDLDLLKGMAIRSIWEERNSFQNASLIYPGMKSGKISASNIVPKAEMPEVPFDEEPPIDEPSAGEVL